MSNSPKIRNYQKRIQQAIKLAMQYGGIEGDHHKAWVIDQMVRVLTGCPIVKQQAIDCNDKPYEFETMGLNAEYLEIVRKACDGEDGPDSYEWEIGIPP